ncbi:ABC transporter permease [Paenibacillus sp. 7541]|uniref:ABC transporter permease n=1 Tax=Paenibacillus sp. 7541 TaxID=2026236 RepID=UPI000BA6FB07|nr:ABC transporter permease [Paenibacillus sp. 7541]PAK55819.1 multidrug ABC transporter permease [Paenibacillus sp. 7541]
MTIFAFALKRSIRSWGNLLLLLGLPMVVILLPRGYDGYPLGFQFYGILQLFFASKLVHMIMEDRKNKILNRIGVAPITHAAYTAQNLLAFSLLLIVQSILIVGGGWLYHGPDLGNLLQLWMIFCFFAFTAISFSLAWCSWFRHPDASAAVMLGIISIMAVLGGTLIPLEVSPEPLQRISKIVPTYWLHYGIDLAAENRPWKHQLTPLLILILFTAAFLLIGSRRRLA